MASDITIVYLTNNRLPIDWQKFHREHIEKLNIPVISVSQKPMDFGINIVQDYPPSKPNIFYQLMRGMRLVKTKYVAVVEDDCLYPEDHFELRPPDEETFVYNKHRWSLYTWNPVYNLKNWIKTGAVLISPTKLALDLLEERFSKYPMGCEMPLGMCGELGVYEKELGLKQRKVIELMSKNPVVQIDHDYFTVLNKEKETVDRRHKKRLGVIQAYSIPYWNESKNLVKYFNEK